MNADGSAPRRLTRTPWSDSPVWSPDGKEVAFIRHFEDPPGNPTGVTPPEIYVMKAGGSERRRLTRNTLHEHALDWSRTG
jgi:TolB protein